MSELPNADHPHLDGVTAIIKQQQELIKTLQWRTKDHAEPIQVECLRLQAETLEILERVRQIRLIYINTYDYPKPS